MGDQLPLEVSVAQAALLCFQGQGEIANPDQLFHRIGDQQVARHLRASLPYLLGAVSGAHARQMMRLQELRRALRRIDAQLEEIAATHAELDVRTVGLAAEALAAGLLHEEPSNVPTRLEALRSLVASPAPPGAPGLGAASQIDRLRAHRRELSQRLRRNREQRASLLALRGDRDAFALEPLPHGPNAPSQIPSPLRASTISTRGIARSRRRPTGRGRAEVASTKRGSREIAPQEPLTASWPGYRGAI